MEVSHIKKSRFLTGIRIVFGLSWDVGVYEKMRGSMFCVLYGPVCFDLMCSCCNLTSSECECFMLHLYQMPVSCHTIQTLVLWRDCNWVLFFRDSVLWAKAKLPILCSASQSVYMFSDRILLLNTIYYRRRLFLKFDLVYVIKSNEGLKTAKVMFV